MSYFEQEMIPLNYMKTLKDLDIVLDSSLFEDASKKLKKSRNKIEYGFSSSPYRLDKAGCAVQPVFEKPRIVKLSPIKSNK